MPRGPKGEKRPGDVIGSAVMVGKNAAAVALERMGGKKRAESMSAKKRPEIAAKTAKTRWRKPE